MPYTFRKDLDTFRKDPDATLDYSVDWTDWLADSETITTIDVEATGVTLDSSAHADGISTAWVSGGAVHTQATVRHRITTSAGRIDDRTIKLSIQHR